MTAKNFRARNSTAARQILSGLLVSALALSPWAGSIGQADDTDLFRASVPPNIMFVVDNSKSMNNSVTHPGFESELPDGTIGKNQSQCRAFRDHIGAKNTLAFWNAGTKFVVALDVNGNKIKGALTDQGYGPIMDRYDASVQGIKNPNASSGAGAPLFYKVVATDQGKGQAHYYDTGLPIMKASDPSQPMYWGGGTNAQFETRITPREVALDNHIDIMTLQFTPGATICNVTVPASTRWSLWAGDPSIEVPSGSTMQIKVQYLDYLFSDLGAEARAASFTPTFANDGRRNYSPCLQLFGADNEYEVYRRSRLIALQKILETVVCEVNQAGIARFGVAQFRFRGGGGLGGSGDGNVQGGYAVLPVNDFKVWSTANNRFVKNKYDLHGYTDESHAKHLQRVISKIGPDSTTPLAETLFQVYTYFMSREADDLPYGRNPDGTSTGVKFPVYSYDTSQPDDGDPKDLDIVGGHYLPVQGDGDANAAAPPSPVEYPCQKNFILFITDGGSYEDVFDMDPTNQPMTDPLDTGQGFGDFFDLIGDHFRNPDGTADEVEWTGAGSKRVLYMDDISYFMNRWDFMPNETLFPGDQTIDTYTVGYALESGGDSNLEKTAKNGNGLYFESADSDQLAADLVEAIADMIEKAQSFTSATVPSSRTADGNNFYSSYFRPDSEVPFWEGHLRAFNFTQSGEILTPAGNCAVGTDVAATPPCGTNGELRISAPPYWDAADQMPAPANRKLYAGRGDTGFLARPPLWSTMDKDDLDLVPTDLLQYPYANMMDSTFISALGSMDPGDDIDDLEDEAEGSLDALTAAIIKNISGCVFGTDCVTRADDAGAVRTLGDFYHSNPIVVGSPNSAVNEGSYKDFAKTYETRTRVIYAGANDGWLHGFDAGTWRTTDPLTGDPLTIPRHDRGSGVEMLGFMPSYVRHTIHDLRPRKGFPRNWYGVDGSPVAGDVWLYRHDGSGAVNPKLPTVAYPKTKNQWRTVLIGGLRDGGPGYYAIDVTNPADATNYPGYLWDFPCEEEHCDSAVNPGTEGEAPYMASTWSEPVITRVRVKGDEDGYVGNGYERWVAIFGAGYDVAGDPNLPDYESDPDESDAKLGRAIFIVDITTGEVLAKKYWSKTATSVSGTQIGFPEMRYAVPSQPAVYDLDFDGFADVIYIGDVGGNLWKWVITGLGDDPINNVAFNDNVAQPNWPFRLFFRASAMIEPALGDLPDFTLLNNHYRSFFFPPTGVLRGNKLVLALGTGERADIKRWDADGSVANNNRYYVVKDYDPLARGTLPDALLGYTKESDLATNALVDSLGCADVNAAYHGFTIYARDAEKFVTNSAIFLGDVITGSFMPPDPTNTNPCEAAGEAFLYRFSVDCAVGAYPDGNAAGNDQRRKSIGKGMPTRPRVSAGALTDAATSTDPCANRVVVVTSDGSVDNECQGTAGSTGIGIRSWRQR